jgi:hypothetical protein
VCGVGRRLGLLGPKPCGRWRSPIGHGWASRLPARLRRCRCCRPDRKHRPGLRHTRLRKRPLKPIALGYRRLPRGGGRRCRCPPRGLVEQQLEHGVRDVRLLGDHLLHAPQSLRSANAPWVKLAAPHGHPVLVFDGADQLHLPLTTFAREATTRLSAARLRCTSMRCCRSSPPTACLISARLVRNRRHDSGQNPRPPGTTTLHSAHPSRTATDCNSGKDSRHTSIIP